MVAPLCIAGVMAAAYAAGWSYGSNEATASVAKRATMGRIAANIGNRRTLAWDPNGSVGNILKEFSAGEQFLALAKLVEATPVSELARLLEEAESCPDSNVRKNLSGLIYAKWAEADPQGALAHALPSMRKGKPDQTQIPNIFMVWGRMDPKAAFAAALKLDGATFRQDAVAKVLENWIQGNDPQSALAALKSLPTG